MSIDLSTILFLFWWFFHRRRSSPIENERRSDFLSKRILSLELVASNRLSHRLLTIPVGYESRASHTEKGLVNVDVILAGALKILAAAKLILQIFAFCGSELSIFSITLVANENQIILRVFRAP